MWVADPARALQEKRPLTLALVARHRAYNVRIFGSLARGQPPAQSDVDLLVDFEPGVSLLDSIALQQDFEDELGIAVDAVTEQTLHPAIRERVLREARSI